MGFQTCVVINTKWSEFCERADISGGFLRSVNAQQASCNSPCNKSLWRADFYGLFPLMTLRDFLFCINPPTDVEWVLQAPQHDYLTAGTQLVAELKHVFFPLSVPLFLILHHISLQYFISSCQSLCSELFIFFLAFWAFKHSLSFTRSFTAFHNSVLLCTQLKSSPCILQSFLSFSEFSWRIFVCYQIRISLFEVYLFVSLLCVELIF